MSRQLDFLPRLARLPRAEWIRDDQSFLRAPETIDVIVDQVDPELVIEVGSWKGHSAIRIAKRLRRPSACVVCVDTWLGSVEHWDDPRLRRHLHLVRGYPTLYRRFLTNVTAAGVARKIRAMPMTSEAAAMLLARHRVRPDLLYIDAAHDEASVTRDLEGYLPLLRTRGIAFGDDADWPGVLDAVRRVARRRSLHHAVLGRYWVLARRREEVNRLFARHWVATCGG